MTVTVNKGIDIFLQIDEHTYHKIPATELLKLCRKTKRNKGRQYVYKDPATAIRRHILLYKHALETGKYTNGASATQEGLLRMRNNLIRRIQSEAFEELLSEVPGSGPQTKQET